MQKIEATPKDLHLILRYDPDTGELRWTDFFMIPLKKRNKLATKKYESFLSVNLLNTTIRAHHLAWALQTGDWPTHQVIHLNGDQTDNRWINLAYRTALNTPIYHKKPASGFPGVYHHNNPNRTRPWFALHTPRDGAGHPTGPRRCLGHYRTKEEAAAALQAAKEREKLSNATAQAIAAHPAPHLDSPGW